MPIHLTVITFKNSDKQTVIRTKKVVDASTFKPGTNLLVDDSTGARMVFNLEDVLYVSQVQEKKE